MQNLKLQEEINALKALGQRYEKQLKLAGIELSDFSDDDMALLDKCVNLGAQLHIHDLNLNNLRDFYCARKKDCIENKLIRAQQQIELRRLRSAIDEAARDVAVLERNKSAAEERLIPENVVLQQNSHQLAIKQSLLDRQMALKVPKDFNIEGIIEKVDSLDRR